MSLDDQQTGQEIETNVSVETNAAVDDLNNQDAKPEGDDAPSGDTDTELNTVRKALEKRNRYINNQRNRIRSLESEIEKLKTNIGQNKQNAPDMDKFESVLDYMKADQNFNLEQKLAEQAQAAKIAALEQQQSMAIEQQAEAVAAHVNELLSSNPEFKSVISANVQVIQSMPEHIEKLMLEIDDAPAATYALAKEGRLASVYSMPPHLAAAHIVQAEIRGQQYLRQTPKQSTQQAPKPIGSLKGTGRTSNPPLHEMTPDQLMKWLKT